jgi:hypothetical protein
LGGVGVWSESLSLSLSLSLSRSLTSITGYLYYDI